MNGSRYGGVWAIVLSSVAACSGGDDGPTTAAPPRPPPPARPPEEIAIVVTSSSPPSGPWGTVFTIEGDDLDRGAQKVTFETAFGGEVAVERSSPFVVSWRRSKVEIRVPFPADGAVAIDGVPAGTFSSTMAVGKKGLVHGGRDPSAVLATAEGELVVASSRLVQGSGRESFLYRMEAEDAEDLPFSHQSATLLRDESGPFAILEQEGFAHARADLSGAGGDPTPIADLPAARIIGSGTDATGPFVWTLSGTVATRHRLAAGAWTADRTVADAYGNVRAVASAPDGTLALFNTTQGGGAFDDYDIVRVQYAGPAGSAFGPVATIVSDMDDSTFSYRVWSKDANAMVVRFCATDEDGVEFDGRACFYWSSDATAAGWGKVDFLQYDGGASARCEEDVLVVEENGTKTDAIFPCRNVAAFTHDPAGRPVFLVGWRQEYRFVFPKP